MQFFQSKSISFQNSLYQGGEHPHHKVVGEDLNFEQKYCDTNNISYLCGITNKEVGLHKKYDGVL